MNLKDLKNTDMTVEQFRKGQWKRGLPLSVFGVIVYFVLRLFGCEPKDYNGVCRYFEIGKGSWGLEFGWFFICGRNASNAIKNHEVGHGVQNAVCGGFRMLLCFFASALRFWYRRIFKIKTPYGAWWYEGNASQLGDEFIEKRGDTR